MFRLFRGATASESSNRSPYPDRLKRRSSGFTEFARAISGGEGLSVLDLGGTSPANIGYLTDLGHRVYNEDLLLASRDKELYDKDEGGKEVISPERFLAKNLKYELRQFDAVLCWDVPDYMEEAVVRPMVDRLCAVMKPGGILLAFFHTKDAGPDAPYYRYHISRGDGLDLQRGPNFRLKRVFQNRHIENLFRDYRSIKFFLARDNVREVLVVR